MKKLASGIGVAALVVVGLLVACSQDDDTEPGHDVEAGVDASIPAPTKEDASTDAARADASDAGPPLVNSCTDAGVVANAWVVDPHLCLTVYAEDVAIARQMAFAPSGDLFVQAAGGIIALNDADHDGTISDTEHSRFVGSITGYQDLYHGLAFSPDGQFVYGSNDTTVFRWPYTIGQLVSAADAEVVVHDIPGAVGHVTRTLVFDKAGHLYVNVGSTGDVDSDPVDLATRGMIRRFTIPSPLPAGGLTYLDGDVYASGMRNEVGLAFDSNGRFWGTENGIDAVSLAIAPYPYLSFDNPGEEINRIDEPGSRAFGYPYCWSEFRFDGGLGNGTQWAYDGESHAACRNKTNVHPPAWAMQGHWASLGIAEYSGGSLPWKGDLIVGSHGSSVRVPPVGRLLARAHLNGDKIESVTPIVGHAVDGKLEEGTWDARPVDIRMGPDQAIYFSDDLGHRIFRLGYRP